MKPASSSIAPDLHPLMVVPWPSLVIGGAFVAWMGLASPVMVGFAAVWMVIFTAAPFMFLAGIAGAGPASAPLGLLMLILCCVTPPIMALVAAWRTRSRAAWAAALNAVVMVAALIAGVFASIMRFGEAWPY